MDDYRKKANEARGESCILHFLALIFLFVVFYTLTKSIVLALCALVSFNLWSALRKRSQSARRKASFLAGIADYREKEHDQASAK